MLQSQNPIKEVDVVFVHQDDCLVDAFSCLATDFDNKADTYLDPHDFLNNVGRYPKHTKILVGRTFNNSVHQGIPIAEQLHALGFTRLYLVVMLDRAGNPVPDYLTVIHFEFPCLEKIFNDDYPLREKLKEI